MNQAAGPEHVINHFFRSLGQFQFPLCWGLFSSKSQHGFMQWTLQEIYRRHNKAAQTVKMGLPEIKFMFENNDNTLIQIFWRKFVYKCNANDFVHYAYFETQELTGNQAVVRATFKYPDGQQKFLVLTMINERGGWKFGYFESGFKID